MSVPWPILTADDWSIAGLENQGQHPHDWLKHADRDRTWLFKPARPERDRSLGEDVVEKLGSEFARLIGVPAAPIELATRHGVRGALVEDVRLPRWELQAGQALIPEVVPDYNPGDPQHRGHNIQTIRTALDRFAAPPAAGLPVSFRAFDAFAGYLVFDALTAHGDRHDRNWAVIVPPPGVPDTEALCASFDHAASLGFTLTEAVRAEHVRDSTVADWAKRGRAYRFEHRRSARWQTLVDVAAAAVALCPQGTRTHWGERILSVDADSVADVVAGAPGVSDVTQQFTIKLVMANRERLLDVLT